MTEKSAAERWIARVLFWGLCLSAAIAFVGGIIEIVHNDGVRVSYRHFVPHVLNLSKQIIVNGRLSGRGLAQLGLLLLVLLQLVRLAAGIRLFLGKGDRVFILISLAILAALVVSLVA